jgi:hypothetical protein
MELLCRDRVFSRAAPRHAAPGAHRRDACAATRLHLHTKGN